MLPRALIIFPTIALSCKEDIGKMLLLVDAVSVFLRWHYNR
jgi:hypothetical protein